jgi:hypothetical protein
VMNDTSGAGNGAMLGIGTGQCHGWLAKSIRWHVVSARIRLGGRPSRADGPACTYSGGRQRLRAISFVFSAPVVSIGAIP